MLSALEDAVMEALAELVERELGEQLVGFELVPIRRVRRASDWTANFTTVGEDGQPVKYRATGTFRVRAGGSEAQVAARVVEWF